MSRVDRRAAAAKKEFGQRRVELQKQMDELLTPEQKQARSSLQEACLTLRQSCAAHRKMPRGTILSTLHRSKLLVKHFECIGAVA